MKRIRALTPHERNLWAHVAKSVKSIKQGPIKAEMSMKDLLDPGFTLILPLSVQDPESPQVLKKQKEETVSLNNKTVTVNIKSKQPPLAPIERNLRRNIKRGKAQIDSKLDLHGLYQDEAHNALLSFINRSSQKGYSLVLVVTGKGGKQVSHGSFDRTGILRRLVPIWLSDQVLRQHVIGFEEADLNHGGAGALYVRLRRSRSKEN